MGARAIAVKLSPNSLCNIPPLWTTTKPNVVSSAKLMLGEPKGRLWIRWGQCLYFDFKVLIIKQKTLTSSKKKRLIFVG